MTIETNHQEYDNSQYIRYERISRWISRFVYGIAFGYAVLVLTRYKNEVFYTITPFVLLMVLCSLDFCRKRMIVDLKFERHFLDEKIQKLESKKIKLKYDSILDKAYLDSFSNLTIAQFSSIISKKIGNISCIELETLINEIAFRHSVSISHDTVGTLRSAMKNSKNHFDSIEINSSSMLSTDEYENLENAFINTYINVLQIVVSPEFNVKYKKAKKSILRFLLSSISMRALSENTEQILK